MVFPASEAIFPTAGALMASVAVAVLARQSVDFAVAVAVAVIGTVAVALVVAFAVVVIAVSAVLVAVVTLHVCAFN